MIKNISFAGKLEINGALRKRCTEKDVKALKKYADNINGDVYIQEAETYKTGEPIYKGYAIVNHTIYDISYDTKNPLKTKKSRTQMPPEYY